MMSRVKVTLTHVLQLSPPGTPTALPGASMSEIWVAKPLPPSSIPSARFQLAAQYSFRTIKQPHE